MFHHLEVVGYLGADGIVAFGELPSIPQVILTVLQRPILFLQISTLVGIAQATPDAPAEVGRQFALVGLLELGQRDCLDCVVNAYGWVARWIVSLEEGRCKVVVRDVVGDEGGAACV